MKGAAQWGIVASVCGLLVMGVASPAKADVTDNDRLFVSFMRETATVPSGQLRLELRGLAGEKAGEAQLNAAGFVIQNANQLDYGTVQLLASYGIANGIEAGFLIPGIWQSVQSATTGAFDNTSGIGDFEIYGKFQRNIYENLNAGGGLEMSMPNGSEEDGLGSGAFGVNPFVSLRYQQGVWGVGAHTGYFFYTADTPNLFNCSLEGFLRVSPAWGFRVEWAQRVFAQSGERIWDSVVVPGLDVNILDDLVVRPTGLVGTTPDSMDWGIGAGLAYFF